MRIEIIACNGSCLVTCPVNDVRVGSKGCGECDGYDNERSTGKYVECKKLGGIYAFIQRMDYDNKNKITFASDDLKEAFAAGGDIVSWNDDSVDNKWSSFEEWFAIYCSKKI